jgi:hypothetical protein
MTIALATPLLTLKSNSDEICTWKDTGFGTMDSNISTWAALLIRALLIQEGSDRDGYI